MDTAVNASRPVATSPHLPSILDLVAPGLSRLAPQGLLAWCLDNYATLVCILGLAALLRGFAGQLTSWLERHFTSTVYIQRTDETYDMLVSWISSRGLDGAARSTIARVGRSAEHCDSAEAEARKPLSFAPWRGRFVFRFGHSFVSYKTELRDAGLHREEEISISCLGRSSRVLRRLLEECRSEYLSRIKHMTTVFENRGNTWCKAMEREMRPLSTIILGERQKRMLVDDVKGFLDAETRRWFARRAIPYRRGYLLYGPPGTGKSSFSLSVAGELRLDMYMVNVPGVNDQTLKELFSKLPPRCVVMLEDIDAVGTARTGETVNGLCPPSWPGTLSGLLNTLDGVASQEGRILIMTTNHVERLDEALVRPGRVDVKAEFRLADATMAMQLFGFVFKPDDVNKVGAKKDEAKQGDELELQALANRFAALVPELELSPAEMISYLQRHRHSPASAVDQAQVWVAEMQRDKRDRSAAFSRSR
ncbi:hypothetical protein XA68_13431 [Ophiocordyceps unilateralis]|uniref:AAA+ ATPase domain-containing protein n=1 Tax=Ophiocordyceps unilateralis TaxID=268505 RepID=A0A2A9PBG9_OPHUN|nr:hypothetical protein XA68_13431 [Ophiocordyceps unilateralis]